MAKAKVYICAHPEDLPLYEDMLKKQLQLLLWCDVFTDEDLTQDPFIHYWLLRDMRLFVLPVTRRLLTDRSLAMRKFRFAREHLIPVIPWLMEEGLEELFTQRCADLPFLRRDDSLDLFIREFRMDRATVLRIRDAFDGMVYLDAQPYDSRYVRQLQGLIHRCTCCENLGFSPDLQPQVGQIYVLVITEHMLKDPALALKHYKMAKALNLPIVAVMMYELDPKRIQAAFPGLTQVVDPYDEGELENVLLDALEFAGIRYTHERTPEQTYLLGLAFLNGVDVEMNRSCGIAYIREAAHADFPEAKKKLALLQHIGDGIRFERGDTYEDHFFGF